VIGLGVFWAGNRLQWSRATHMTIVLSINDGLTDRVSTLKDFETLEGYIVKIETLVTELKITLNFRGVICTFPFLWRRKTLEREREREPRVDYFCLENES
jgi:hypothetical protein